MDKILPYLKAYASLVGAIVTALLGVYTADTEVGKVLTIVAVIATVIATWAVPNIDPTGEHQDESVQPVYDTSLDGVAPYPDGVDDFEVDTPLPEADEPAHEDPAVDRVLRRTERYQGEHEA